MAVPNVTLTAKLDSILGGVDVAGYLEITLCGFGLTPPSVAGTAMLADAAVPQLSGPATTLSIKLFGNDQITPGNTFYSIAVLDADKNVIQQGNYLLTGAGTYDLSNLSPILPPSAIGSGILVALFQAAPTMQDAAGTVDGANTLFTFTAPAGATPLVAVYAGGVYQSLANGDYSLAYLGANTWQITFAVAPNDAPIAVLLFQLNGSGSRTITAPDTIVVNGATPDNTLFCDFAAPGAITLPAAATAGISYELTFIDVSYNASVNNITLTGNVNNAASYVINTDGGAVTLRSDGTVWRVKSKV